MKVRRIYVEKKNGFDIEAKSLYTELKQSLQIDGLEHVRILNRYDVESIDDETFSKAKKTIFSEPAVDQIYEQHIALDDQTRCFAVEYLPGQYDQRADSAAQCIQILNRKEKPMVKSAKLIVLEGNLSDEDFSNIKKYCINPVDSHEAAIEIPKNLTTQMPVPSDVKIIEGFIHMSNEDLQRLRSELGLAMSIEDIAFVQNYFRLDERRNPTLTELKVLDTYWSDHCRHTTFLTEITDIKFDEGKYNNLIEEAYKAYMSIREAIYIHKQKPMTLMDMAVAGMKYFKLKGKLQDLDESEEINACSIKVNAVIDKKEEEWLVMFKNETHNHPTEIEPFGGAATCLGGAIRDPLSGRSYVYQAMRVTGSGDPRQSLKETLPGKLPQKKITTEAAHGYSSYGNQIGLATGQVAEIYDEGFVAKRMEVGAVIAAAPKENVIRKRPKEGDHILLVGGRTGRDGCGGATGSSKEHTEESILDCGAEVQKGNPPTQRNIQRLFRRKEAATLIKRCNDFGAGGISVAIGELAESLEVDLDLVPKKYNGLDGTELAISESQERMAVVVSKSDVETFIGYADEENLEAVTVAKVTNDGRFRMTWRGKCILDLSRDFLDTNGIQQKRNIKIQMPKEENNFFKQSASLTGKLKHNWINNLKDLNIASQKGLVERFDSTIGKGTVLMPLGGKYQRTPAEGMAAKLPVQNKETDTATLMTYGYYPKLSKWSPFHGAFYAVIDSVTKIAAMGGDCSKARLSFQEYFEKLGDDAYRWGKPFAALLGALKAQKELEIPSIGGKDSMSGTFMDLDVPPTLISFAVTATDAKHIISPEFKKEDSCLVWVYCSRDENEMIDTQQFKEQMDCIQTLIKRGKVLSAKTVGYGGVAAAISKMAVGNMIGANIEGLLKHELFDSAFGSVLLEIDKKENIFQILKNTEYKVIGSTLPEKAIHVSGEKLCLDEIVEAWTEPLESTFPTKDKWDKSVSIKTYNSKSKSKSTINIAKPRVLIPAFPGTNCEEDSKKSFDQAGAKAGIQIFRNLTPNALKESIDELVKNIKASQIIMIPGGFSGGDEPDGSAKFITAVFRNPKVAEAVMDLIHNREGLMIGICNGFQALIKLGLVPYGEIRELTEDDPTLTYNKIGRHVSALVRTKIVSVKSPWLSQVELGDIHTIPISHGEGRFIIKKDLMNTLIKNGQVATQYVDLSGDPTYDIRFNPNGSEGAIEGITSPDGRIFGKMGHSERIGEHLYKNVQGETDQKIFKSGVNYYK